MGAPGSMKIVKLPIRCSRNPGIGSGRCSRTIPQIINPIDPNEMSAIPKAFRMAAIVTIAHIVVNGDYTHNDPERPDPWSMSAIGIYTNVLLTLKDGGSIPPEEL